MLTIFWQPDSAVQGGTPMTARGEDSLSHWLGTGRHSSLCKYPRGDERSEWGADSPPVGWYHD